MKKCCNSNLQMFMQKIILYHNFFSYLTGKWNLDIDFIQVLTRCNIYNFSLIEKYYQDNQQRFITTIKNQYWNFCFFQKHKKWSSFLNFGWMWLVNELILTFLAPIKCTKAQFNLTILSRVMPHTTYRQTDRQTLS